MNHACCDAAVLVSTITTYNIIITTQHDDDDGVRTKRAGADDGWTECFVVKGGGILPFSLDAFFQCNQN